MKNRLPIPVQRAMAVLAVERAIPAYLPAFIGSALIFAALWLGAYAYLPARWHLFALVGSGILLTLLVSLGMARFQFPTRRETLRRIEERSDLKPGILDSALSQPFGGDDEAPLWRASRERLAQIIGKPKLPLPRIAWQEVDPWRLRYLAVVAPIVALAATKLDEDGLRASLLPPVGDAPQVLVDAWIEPPAYTGLTATLIDISTQRYRVVPEDSVLHVRLRGENGRPAKGVLTFKPETGRRQRIKAADGDSEAQALKLTETGTLTVTTRTGSKVLRLMVREDRAPSITLKGDADTSTGVVRLEAETADDYPIEGGMMTVSLLPGQRISPDAPMPEQRILDIPAKMELPVLAGPPGERLIEVDTEEHPWAGLLVKAVIEITDGRGQTAESEPFAFTMPERTFYNPLSKAVIEERRKLAMAPNHLNDAASLLRALTTAPDLFDVEASDHLMLKATSDAVTAAKQRDVPDLVESLWPLAIELEDEGLAYAKAQLDAAEAALREALRNGARNEEIAARIADLKAAMDAYARALAESGLAEATDPQPGQVVSQADIDEMFRRMQELADQGLREEAEALLRQLEAMLQSLQLAQGQPGEGQGNEGGQGTPGGSGEGSGGPGQQALSGTGDLMQRQRELSDETFSARRGDRGTEGLGTDQQSLADELGRLRGELPSDAEGAGEEAFGRAEDAMRDAAEALENGQLGLAQQLQERAIDALREGGQQLAEALGDEGGGDGEDGSLEGVDPLGRAWRGENGADPEDFGLYDPERIRELIAQIRERLADPGLGEAERKYLESLLERF